MRSRGSCTTTFHEQLARHSRSEKQVPPRELEAWHSGENHQSLCSTAVNSCIAMSRGHSSMKGCGFSFISFFVFIFLGFPLRSSCFLPPAVPDPMELCGDIAQTECFAALQSPGGGAQALLSGQRWRRMEIALGTSSLLYDRKTHGCIQGLQGPHGLHVTGGQRGHKPFCTNACPPAHSYLGVCN